MKGKISIDYCGWTLQILVKGDVMQYYNFASSKSFDGLIFKAFETLINYEFPGNVRELENLIERGVALCNGQMVLGHVGGLTFLDPRLRPVALEAPHRRQGARPSPHW